MCLNEKDKGANNVSLYEKLLKNEEVLSVIGLGYVGLPLAAAFSEKIKTIGFDVNSAKIEAYKNGIDPTNELGTEALRACAVDFTSDAKRLAEAKFHIIAVPTPINGDNGPDLSYVESACTILGRYLKKGSIVVSESTVYPGVTEDVCIPILEKESGLKCGVDFKVGYSPERINPGDKVHTLQTIVKVVSGMDEECLDEIAKTYELVVEAGVHRVSSIKAAEAVKAVENTQRDVNIAFMNEMALLFQGLGIDTGEVVTAMNTKWNALKFYPGLVGGHCISVDPHYLLHGANKMGHNSRIVRESRRLNDIMSKIVGDAIIKQLIKSNKMVTKSKVAILGLSFKENTPDIRNSKIMDVINQLRCYGISPMVVDPVASAEEAKREFDIDLVPLDELNDLDCIVCAVPHDGFKGLTIETMDKLFGNLPNDEKILIDIRGKFSRAEAQANGYRYWSL